MHCLTAFSLAQLLIRNARKKEKHIIFVTLTTPNNPFVTLTTPNRAEKKEKHREKEMISTNGLNIDFKSLQLEKKDMFILWNIYKIYS